RAAKAAGRPVPGIIQSSLSACVGAGPQRKPLPAGPPSNCARQDVAARARTRGSQHAKEWRVMERKYKGKVMVGRVVSDKMQKTVVVVVETRRRHPLYGKTITVRRRFKAHNENPKAKAGDTVKIVESRPLSRTKHWRVVEITRAGEMVEMIRDKELESL